MLRSGGTALLLLLLLQDFYETGRKLERGRGRGKGGGREFKEAHSGTRTFYAPPSGGEGLRY